MSGEAPISQCEIHGCVELITPKTFRVCSECGHVFETEDELVAAYLQKHRSIPENYWTCPLCTHDF